MTGQRLLCTLCVLSMSAVIPLFPAGESALAIQTEPVLPETAKPQLVRSLQLSPHVWPDLTEQACPATVERRRRAAPSCRVEKQVRDEHYRVGLFYKNSLFFTVYGQLLSPHRILRASRPPFATDVQGLRLCWNKRRLRHENEIWC